jgi:hypothetical protein
VVQERSDCVGDTLAPVLAIEAVAGL